MTPNEICREIVNRLQLDGGMPGPHDDQSGCDDWEVRCANGSNYRFSNLNHVAEAIRASKGLRWAVLYRDGTIWAGVCGDLGIESKAIAQTEAEALTRALHAYLRAEKIGEEHLQPPEPEEPWIDVSESVSTANLPKHGLKCDLEFMDSRTETGWFWNVGECAWNACKGTSYMPKALGGSVVKWRPAK